MFVYTDALRFLTDGLFVAHVSLFPNSSRFDISGYVYIYIAHSPPTRSIYVVFWITVWNASMCAAVFTLFVYLPVVRHFLAMTS